MSDETPAPADTPPPAARISFTEGSLQLPAGYEDRSTNLLVPANTQTQPNLSVARDWMKPGENLPAYIERQLSLLKSQLASHKLLSRGAAQLGDPALVEDDARRRIGPRIDASYKNGKLLVFQRQAAFEVAPRRVLIFTASRANGFGEAFEQLWADWLASYRAPAVVDGSDSAGSGGSAAE